MEKAADWIPAAGWADPPPSPGGGGGVRLKKRPWFLLSSSEESSVHRLPAFFRGFFAGNKWDMENGK